MSGIEIAGIVLGALPLLVNAICDYNNGIRKLKRMRHLFLELESLQSTLDAEWAMLLNSVEWLLCDDLDSRTMWMLLGDLGGPLWKEESVERVLQNRLQRDYNVFVAAVLSMNNARLDLQRRLDLNPDEQSSWRQALRNLKASLSLNDYDQELSSISTSNDRIDRLVTQNRRLLRYRKSRANEPNYDEIRRGAKNIFVALQSGFKDYCGSGHFASLELETYSYRRASAGTATENSTAKQKLILHHEATDPSKASLWRAEAADIQFLGQGLNKAGKVPVFIQETTVRRRGSAKPVNLEYRITRIQNLCQSLAQMTPRASETCFGYVSDSLSSSYYGLSWPQNNAQVPATEAESLDTFLMRQAKHWLPDLLKRKLGLSLARATLHLFDTPWLQSHWGRKQIYVLWKSSPSGAREDPRAFISADLKGSTSRHAYFQNCFLIKNETVFALGVLLIEVCLERTFDNLCKSSGLVSRRAKSPFNDYVAAEELLDIVYKRLGSRYGDVVRRCIRCEFDQRRADFDNPEFRKAVYNGVVVELERDIQWSGR